MEDKLITKDIKKALVKQFEELRDPVKIEVFTKEGENDNFNKATITLMEALPEINSKISATFHTVGDKQAGLRNVSHSPTVLIAPDKYSIRYTGAPLGEEGRSLVTSIVMASTGGLTLSDKSLRRLEHLKEKRHVQVFVSPTCPYCPQQFLYAVSAAIAKPDLVSAEAVEIYENREMAEELGVVSVPQTFINHILGGQGLQPEDVFTETLLAASGVEELLLSEGEASGETVVRDMVIVGGGPAGLTAAIYAERSGLSTVVLEKGSLGGQVAITPSVENYPGFANIGGKALVDLMAAQATEYSDIRVAEEVRDIEKSDSSFIVRTNKSEYKCQAVLLVTGAGSKKLQVPGEQRLFGRGVSYCSTCDGYVFKDSADVVVVGGGNTAAVDALYLHNLGARVTIIHRRDTLRAEQRLRQSIEEAGINIMYNSEIKEILGDKAVSSVMVEKDNKPVEVKVRGVFIAIGYSPNSRLAEQLGLELDSEGYIKTNERQMTSMPMVFAAGDITGGVKQIVEAVAQGAKAAMSAFEEISSPYWKKEP